MEGELDDVGLLHRAHKASKPARDAAEAQREQARRVARPARQRLRERQSLLACAVRIGIAVVFTTWSRVRHPSRPGCEWNETNGDEVRRSYAVAAPAAVGALVFALAATYPASAVHGSGSTGPKPPASVLTKDLGPDYQVRWAENHRAIVLRVRDGAACRPRIRHEGSTGPARVEVTLEGPVGTRCRLAPRWWNLSLQPPTIHSRHQRVSVQVNGARTTLSAPRA